jgi:hypothetical protein
MWSGRITISPIKYTDPLILIEYKYVIVEKSNDNSEVLVRWESLESPNLNRRLYLNRNSVDTLKVLDE